MSGYFIVYQGTRGNRHVLSSRGTWVRESHAGAWKRYETRAEADKQVEALKAAIPRTLFGVLECQYGPGRGE